MEFGILPEQNTSSVDVLAMGDKDRGADSKGRGEDHKWRTLTINYKDEGEFSPMMIKHLQEATPRASKRKQQQTISYKTMVQQEKGFVRGQVPHKTPLHPQQTCRQDQQGGDRCDDDGD